MTSAKLYEIQTKGIDCPYSFKDYANYTPMENYVLAHSKIKNRLIIDEKRQDEYLQSVANSLVSKVQSALNSII